MIREYAKLCVNVSVCLLMQSYYLLPSGWSPAQQHPEHSDLRWLWQSIDTSSHWRANSDHRKGLSERHTELATGPRYQGSPA